MKKLVTLLLVMLLAVCVLTACGCKHEWEEADCNDPKTCKLCGETEGEDLGHDYAEPDCEHGKLCSRCGKEKGEALGHEWVDADCVNPVTCSRCGTTEGEALGHNLSDATCTDAPTCYTCGEVVGEALGHTWLDATTEAPKTCSVCGATEGEPLPGSTLTMGCDLYTFTTTLDSSLQGLGSYLQYETIDADGNYIYGVWDLATSTDLNIDLSITVVDGLVYGVLGYTEDGAISHTSEVLGNCFGIVAVIADSTFTNADLQAMISNPQTDSDSGITYYYYEKNGFGFLMAFQQVGEQVNATIAIAPLD